MMGAEGQELAGVQNERERRTGGPALRSRTFPSIKDRDRFLPVGAFHAPACLCRMIGADKAASPTEGSPFGSRR